MRDFNIYLLRNIQFIVTIYRTVIICRRIFKVTNYTRLLDMFLRNQYYPISYKIKLNILLSIL